MAKSTKTRHISTSFTLLNLLNLRLNSLNLKDRKVWKLYRDDTTTTTTVNTNRQKEYLHQKLIPIWTEESFLQNSTLTLLQIIPIHDKDNSLSQILLKKTSTNFIKSQL
jgi:hypothetical protein